MDAFVCTHTPHTNTHKHLAAKLKLASMLSLTCSLSLSPSLPYSLPPSLTLRISYPVCEVNMDIVFMLDQSGSVGRDNHNTALQFLQQTVSFFQIASNGTQVNPMAVPAVPPPPHLSPPTPPGWLGELLLRSYHPLWPQCAPRPALAAGGAGGHPVHWWQDCHCLSPEAGSADDGPGQAVRCQTLLRGIAAYRCACDRREV